MAHLSLDDAAWTSRWRGRSTAEKAVLALGLLAVAVSADGPAGGVLVLVVATIAACGLARVPVRTWARGLASPMLFVIPGLVAIAVTFRTPVGELAWSWGPLSVTEESARRAAAVGFRALGGISAMLLLATTTPMPHLLAALGRVRGCALFADIAGLVYRMLFGLLDTQRRIRESQAARLGFGSSRAARRSIGMLGAATLIRAWTAAQRLEAGLAGRGDAGAALGRPAVRPVDWPFVVAATAVVAAALTASLVGPSWAVVGR